MKENFGEVYASLYDSMYASKNYKSEAEFIIRLLKSNSRPVLSILDLGCGTGNHDSFLQSAGFQVTGIDKSRSMIEIAKEKFSAYGCQFLEADIASLNTGKTYDVVLSLFHVLSYQIEDFQIEAFFQTLKRHMHSESRAIIDFWYDRAVKKTGAQITRKSFSIPNGNIDRIATPALLADKSAYEIKIRLEITAGDRKSVHEEGHFMRYFSTDEIKKFASQAGLELVELGQWLKEDIPPDENSWTAFAVFKVKS